jgi:anhydro-N-acetylmuramic acid kinase
MCAHSWLDKLRRQTSRTIVGINSGTSVDGIHVAIARVLGSGEGASAQLIGNGYVPYSTADRHSLLEISAPPRGTVDKICAMNFRLGGLFAAAVAEVCASQGVALSDIDLIASRGHTIYHIPPRNGNSQGSTLQIGEPSVIAESSGVVTVAEFGARDVAAGGHGAPLVAYGQYLVFKRPGRVLAIQNIGGIANVTVVDADKGPDSILAFDTGPGNMLIDGVVHRISGGELTYDVDGMWAAEGEVQPALLEELMKHPYIAQVPPKSTGREVFGGAAIDEVLAQGRSIGISRSDLVATLTAFTVESIHLNYERFVFPYLDVDEIVIGGGGAHNPVMMDMLRHRFHPIAVSTTEEHGMPVDAWEAMAWIMLANEAVMGNPNNAPAATGARRWTILGKLLPGTHGV